ncbi:MAG: hypothetical protein L6V93_19855 [Clostridiales bacterium]|nr:MAG: hypothetical protein L6V93_19855 [Clostridiales bacterium]
MTRPLSHVMEFNGGLLTVSGGILRSENVNVNAAQNKKLRFAPLHIRRECARQKQKACFRASR